MSTQLLIDARPIKLTLDESGEDGKVIARGEFARCDVPTQNGRKYSRALYEREINKLQTSIKKRRCFGELDHPADGKTMLQRVSHLVTSLKIADDGRVVGEAEILDTPAGKTLKAILSAGAEAGVSSRGFGSTKPSRDGTTTVGDDFVLRTFDFVADPAMQSAYPDIFTEDVDQPEFTIEDLANSFPELVEEITVSQTQEELDRIIQRERESVKVAMEDKFTAKLAEALAGVREDLKEDVRKEYERSESNIAHVALHKISEIIAPMVAGLSPSEETLKDALDMSEDRVRELEAKLEESRNMLQITGFAMHVESRIGGHSKKETIKRLLGKVSHYENTEELDARIDEIVEEFQIVLDAERAKDEIVSEGLHHEVNRLVDENSDLIDQVESLRVRLKTALNESQNAKVDAYKQKKASGYTNSQELMNLLESAGTESQIDKVIDNYGRRNVSDDSLETLRKRLQRGNLRKESQNIVEESTSSTSTTLDVSFSEIKALAGLN